MRSILPVFLVLLMNFSLKAAEDVTVIPFPNKVELKEGWFEIKSQLTVSLPSALRSELEVVEKVFADEYSISLIPSKNARLEFRIDKQLPAEGYSLSVGNDKIIASVSTKAGCFYAFQTLRQMMKLTGSGSYLIRNCEIKDQPAFEWRAYLLDEARYFKGMQAVKDLLDELAMLKINRFQWHLTDDSGWRIEIKKYPLLTLTGAWRDSSQLRSSRSREYDPHPHGGFYTQEEIKEIVGYAAKRHITIVPEIEMPGHMSAAISAYQWLGASGQPVKVPVAFGVKYDVLNVAGEKVYEFLEDVLKEVMELFPGNVIHIGGDEVRHDQWKNNQQITAMMKENKLGNYSDVHVYFINRISNFIEKSGRRMMGWNDIMGTNVHEWSNEANTTQSLARSSIIHFWKGEPALLNDAIEKGYDVVNSYHIFTYLDYTYKSIPLKKAYDFSPVPEGLQKDKLKQVLGLGCQMWGEWIPTVADMHRQTFPRVAAYAESGWTNPDKKDYERFLLNLEKIRRHWDSRGILYYREGN